MAGPGRPPLSLGQKPPYGQPEPEAPASELPKLDVSALLQTPEAQKAIADNVAAILAQLVPPPPASSGPASTPESWVQGLALAIANLSDQGTGRRPRISPEVQLARDDARTKMWLAIGKHRDSGSVPVYQLTGAVVLDDRFIAPTYRDPISKKIMPQKIEWGEVPNEQMVPINESAREIFDLFMASIGGQTGEKKERVAPGKVRILHQDGGPDPGRIFQGPNEPATGSVKLLGLDVPGEVKELRVLGTVAKPVRSVA